MLPTVAQMSASWSRCQIPMKSLKDTYITNFKSLSRQQLFDSRLAKCAAERATILQGVGFSLDVSFREEKRESSNLGNFQKRPNRPSSHVPYQTTTISFVIPSRYYEFICAAGAVQPNRRHTGR